MLTPKQNFLETIRQGGSPDRLTNCYTSFQMVGGDPIFHYLRDNRVKGTISYDRWGTKIDFSEGQIAPCPIVTEETQVIKDIEEWENYVKVPDLHAVAAAGDWAEAYASKAALDSDRYLSLYAMGTGTFEQCHMLMTFEDTLCNFLMYPDEMHALIDAITEYRLAYMQEIVEHLHPDAILSHDDWGSKNSLFMHPDTWREFFKEPYRKLYTYLKENGVIILHHSDSFCEPIVSDMIDIGVDVWQGVIPDNDIVRLGAEHEGKICLMGGIDSVIDRADSTEEEIRAEARRACETYGKVSGFMPSYTYGGPGTLFPHVMPILHDEINKYNMETYGVAGI